MSLIVEVLKRAQKDVAAKKSPPPFIKYPYKEGLSLRAIISRHVWLFSGAMGFGIILLFMVLMITRQGREFTPKPAVPKPVTRSQEFSRVLPEAHTIQEKSAHTPPPRPSPARGEVQIQRLTVPPPLAGGG